MKNLSLPQIQDEYSEGESEAVAAVFLAKIHSEEGHSNGCNTQPC